MNNFYKYASGYVAVDDQNLYLTTSVNPNETRNLTEKNAVTEKENKRRVKRNSALLYIPLALAIVSSAVLVGADKLKFAPLMVVYFMIYFVHKHFRRKLGNHYKIPLAKINAVEPVEGGLKIIFRNEAGEPDFEEVKGLEQQGVEKLYEVLKRNAEFVG